MVKIVKRDGRVEDFVKEKIVVSCYKAGAPLDVAREIADEVEKKIHEGMSTDEIRELVLKELERRNPEWRGNFELYDILVKGRVTYEKGKYMVVPKGHPLYLGTQVADIGRKGLSDVREVESILKQLEEDLQHGISRATIHRRTYILFLAVLRTRKMDKESKLKAIEAINKFREKLGWRPFKIKRPLE
ncbi:MAG: ATP-binding protein [Thermoprotei archaeon]|nr:MAG: ATP-binding protein [Thermoprotei archaeon]RLE99067.1 MAG: ATP-binding protein [Thermoprotei archaeon]HDI75539.1 ATP-binding protein [Thermoprotei archaeon]